MTAASLCAVAPSAARAQAAPGATSDASVADAREAFERGVVAIAAQRFDEAIEALERSYALRASPVVLYNLGLAYRGRGRVADAVDAFERYLRAPEAGADPDRLTALRDEVAGLSHGLATVALTVEPMEAHVAVDGAPRVTSEGPLRLDPGPHVIDVSAPPRFVSQRRSLELGPGATASIDVRLRPATGAALIVSGGPHGGGGDESAGARGPRVSPLVWVGAGLAAVTAGTALVLALEGDAIAADYRSQCASVAPTLLDACRAREARDQRTLDTYAITTDVLWGAAAASAALAVVGIVVSAASGPPRTRASVARARWIVRAGPSRATVEFAW